MIIRRLVTGKRKYGLEFPMELSGGEVSLFQLFLTTKFAGMVIGLSLIVSIAETHGGTLTFAGNPAGSAILRCHHQLERMPMKTAIPTTDTIHVVDDDPALRDSLSVLLQAHDFEVVLHENAEQFLGCAGKIQAGCVLIDVNMPGMSGIDLLAELRVRGFKLPCIVMTGAGQVSLAVRAMKAGAADFVEKPFESNILIESLREALMKQPQSGVQEEAAQKLSRLTPRERDVMIGIASGQQNKVIANTLGISPRTVEIHRARVMTKLEANSLADVVKLSLVHKSSLS